MREDLLSEGREEQEEKGSNCCSSARDDILARRRKILPVLAYCFFLPFLVQVVPSLAICKLSGVVRGKRRVEIRRLRLLCCGNLSMDGKRE